MSDTEPIEYMITTVDNPFDPFDQFDEWLAYDLSMGYNSLGLVARIVKNSDDLSIPDQEVLIQQAIADVVSDNVTGKFRKVARTTTEH